MPQWITAGNMSVNLDRFVSVAAFKDGEMPVVQCLVPATDADSETIMYTYRGPIAQKIMDALKITVTGDAPGLSRSGSAGEWRESSPPSVRLPEL
jgi:hypothetical protein